MWPPLMIAGGYQINKQLTSTSTSTSSTSSTSTTTTTTTHFILQNQHISEKKTYKN